MSTWRMVSGGELAIRGGAPATGRRPTPSVNAGVSARNRSREKARIGRVSAPMRFENVHIEAVGLALPQQIVTSTDLEGRLSVLYERLGVSLGRLELMSGIRGRRCW